MTAERIEHLFYGGKAQQDSRLGDKADKTFFW